MDRRSFLKLGALSATAGAAGACGQVAQKVIPYVTIPDDGVNPVDGYYYATTCQECNAGCGVIVRTVNGRAKKIEGNAAHPISRGSACARGQAAVQRVYHPERLSKPLALKGPKGSGAFEPVSWEEAVEILGKKLLGAEGQVFYLNNGANDLCSGIAAAVFGAMPGFMMAGNRDPGVESQFAGGADLREYPRVPYPDLENAEFSLLFGADIFESDRSPVFFGRAFGASRRDRASIRGRLVYAGSRLSSTAAACDKWIPTPPGRLGILALSVAQVVVETVISRGLAQSIPRNAMGRFSDALATYAPEKVAAELETQPDVIRRLALPFVEEAPAVAIAGDDMAGHTNGVAGVDAVEFLNMISYEIGREKLRIKPRLTPEPDYDLAARMAGWFGLAPDQQSFRRLKKLSDDALSGRFKVGIISHTNPVFDTPAPLKFADALKATPFVAVFASFMDETAALADLILPDFHWLEGWSAEMPVFAPGVPVLNLRQPVVAAYRDARAQGDILLAAARRAGMAAPADSADGYLLKFIAKFRAEMLDIPPLLTDREALEFLLRRGGWWPSATEAEPEPAPGHERLWKYKDRLATNPPLFDGAQEGAFHLHPYQTAHLGRGAGANQAWLQEAPDPITTLMWQSWIEMNPSSAARLGLVEGDLVTVTSPHGSITAPVFPYPGIRPDVVALPLGYGHTNYGALATGLGANPMALLGLAMDDRSGALAWRSQMVTVKKAGGSVKMLRNAHPEGEYKGEIFQL